MRKGEIACYKQFLLFSQCFLQLYISLVRQNAVLCGNGLEPEVVIQQHMYLYQENAATEALKSLQKKKKY